MLSDYLKDKKIVLLGFGREGLSSYRYIRKFFTSQLIGIADKNENLAEDTELINDTNLKLHLGEDYLSGLNSYDIIIKSPGISKTLLENIGFNGEITSQTDLFLRFYSSQTVGITGTKGKSTTTHLLFDVLKRQFDNVVLAGNMGIPFFDVTHEMNDKTIVVSELSSHQLEGITVAPHIAILLNMFEEHLDYYKSYDEYKQAKMNIARFQEENDIFIYSLDNDELKTCVEQTPVISQKYAYSLESDVEKGCCLRDEWVVFKDEDVTEKLYDTNNQRILKGTHNLSNIMAVCLVSELLNVDKDVLNKGISEFKGLEHRLEYVGEFKGIYFYNDSISTIPQATIEALKALKNVDTLILGGFDRGIDYQPLYDFLKSSTVCNLVFVGKAGERMYNEISYKLQVTSYKLSQQQIFPLKGEKGDVEELHCETACCRSNPLSNEEEQQTPSKESIWKNCLLENDYKRIVEWCFEYTEKGKICLLSPAASSYDTFKNFEERGRVFKELVKGER